MARKSSSLLFVFWLLALPVRAEIISLYWSGKITEVTAFDDDSPPNEIAVGKSVAGRLIVDTHGFDSNHTILGSHTYGQWFRYTDNLYLTVWTDELLWELIGGKLSMTGQSSGDGLSFDVLTGTELGASTIFPNIADIFSAGFALIGQDVELLVQVHADEPNVNLAGFSYGTGSVSTSSTNENGDLIRGYHFEFVISDVSATPIPEPSSAGLWAASCTGLVILMRRRRL